MPLPNARMLKVGAFGADAASRARFAAGFFDSATVSSVFAPASIPNSVLADPAGNQVDDFSPPTNGQTVFTLSKTPADSARVFLVINGLELRAASGEITVSGTTVTFVPGVAGYTISTTDDVYAVYAVYAP